MKTISANLQAHLAGDVVTLAHLWLCTLANGAVHAFTDHDQDILYNGVTYAAASGFTASKISNTSALNVANMEVTGMLSGASLLESDIINGLWDYAKIQLDIVNYNDLTMGSMNLRTGYLGNVKTGRQNFYAELRSLAQPLQQVIGRLTMPVCDAQLGDARCGVNLASWTVTGTVTSSASNYSFTDTARTEATGYFDGGKITWTSGANIGSSSEIKTSVGTLITMQAPTSAAIQTGDTYSMIAGCNKLVATCNAKFSNVVNFRGFPYVPGKDRFMSGG